MDNYTQFRTVNLFQAGVLVVAIALLVGYWWALPRLVGSPDRPVGVLAKTVRTAGIAASAVQFVSGMFAVAPTLQLAGDGNTDVVETLERRVTPGGRQRRADGDRGDQPPSATAAAAHRSGWFCVAAAVAAASSSVGELTGGQYLRPPFQWRR